MGWKKRREKKEDFGTTARLVTMLAVHVVPCVTRDVKKKQSTWSEYIQLVCNFGFVRGRGFKPWQALRKRLSFPFIFVCLPFFLFSSVFCCVRYYYCVFYQNSKVYVLTTNSACRQNYSTRYKTKILLLLLRGILTTSYTFWIVFFRHTMNINTYMHIYSAKGSPPGRAWGSGAKTN